MSTAAERSAKASVAVEASWAYTADRPARTAKAHRALEQKWLDLADGDPVRAEHFRRMHYQKMTLKSLQARRRKREAREAASGSEAP